MLGVFRMPFLEVERKITLSKWLTIGHIANSFALGASFAFEWTPCVGLVLASIILVVSTYGAVFEGVVLLSVFSLGLAVPFLTVAIFYGQMTRFIERSQKILLLISYSGGVFLVLFGILLLLDTSELFIYYGFTWFDFLNYEAIQKYL